MIGTELIIQENLPEIPEAWNYKESIERIKPLIYKWKNLTQEIAHELYIAREKLSEHGGDRRSFQRDKCPVETWASYCESIGLEKRTANRWLAAIYGFKKLTSPPLPKLESQVIYADPPWSYNNEGFDESAVNQYPTLTLEEICNFTDSSGRKIKQLTSDRAVLFLWVTYPLAPEGMDVIKAWGFQYRAQMVWVKNKTLPIGWWVKPRHELLYIACKGIEMMPSVKFDSVFEYEVTTHSKKPEIVYEWIEKMYSGPYIELFARNTRPGWESWGNELK